MRFCLFNDFTNKQLNNKSISDERRKNNTAQQLVCIMNTQKKK